MGKESTVNVRIKNSGATEINLTKDILNAFGSFAVVNSCRPIPPNSTFVLLVQFKPISQRIFNEVQQKLLLYHIILYIIV